MRVHTHTHTAQKDRKYSVSLYCDWTESTEQSGDYTIYLSKMIYHNYNHHQDSYNHNIEFSNTKTWIISLGISIHFILFFLKNCF